jgi:hypothetical protein
MALYHLPDPHWGVVKKYCLKELKTVSLSYHSYRKLCKQLVEIGLAEPIERNTYARDYRLTLYGHQTAGIIEEVLKKVNECKTHHIKTPKH